MRIGHDRVESAMASASPPAIDKAFPKFAVRPAQPADVRDLMRMKVALAAGDGALDAVCATADDWMRDLFGSDPRFVAFVAVHDGALIGMATCSKRYVTGWPGLIVFLQDLFVDAPHRQHGVGAALIARVAAYSELCGSPIIEVSVGADNPARAFYRRTGFLEVSNCATYVGGAEMVRKLARSE